MPGGWRDKRDTRQTHGNPAGPAPGHGRRARGDIRTERAGANVRDPALCGPKPFGTPMPHGCAAHVPAGPLGHSRTPRCRRRTVHVAVVESWCAPGLPGCCVGRRLQDRGPRDAPSVGTPGGCGGGQGAAAWLRPEPRDAQRSRAALVRLLQLTLCLGHLLCAGLTVCGSGTEQDFWLSRATQTPHLAHLQPSWDPQTGKDTQGRTDRTERSYVPRYPRQLCQSVGRALMGEEGRSTCPGMQGFSDTPTPPCRRSDHLCGPL